MTKPNKKAPPENHVALLPADYGKLLGEIKARILSAQYEAFKAVTPTENSNHWLEKLAGPSIS